MKRYEFNKLVRNKLPARMNQEGVVITGKALGKEEYSLQLKHKLLEEASEVMEANSISNIRRELADVLEVIHAIAQNYDISLEDIENERLEKREVNGHFVPEHYIHYIEVALDNKKVIDYLEDDNRHYKYAEEEGE